jgi:hypothetical protein
MPAYAIERFINVLVFTFVSSCGPSGAAWMKVAVCGILAQCSTARVRQSNTDFALRYTLQVWIAG